MLQDWVICSDKYIKDYVDKFILLFSFYKCDYFMEVIRFFAYDFEWSHDSNKARFMLCSQLRPQSTKETEAYDSVNTFNMVFQKVL